MPMTRQRISSIAAKIFAGSFVLLIAGFVIPQKIIMPVEGATRKSYSQNSFWAYPWGKSVTHKGVDIFAKKGTGVRPATGGIVLFKGTTPRGGNVVYILGPKWRIHYYAHLDKIKTKRLSFVSSGTVIGTVGNTGNAIGKPSHLHYTIKTIIPYPWRIDKSIQGKRKMFYLNPITYLNKAFG
jgi:murein DD-endopeptidase MepM/ murein hydrolase activator NlpD